MRPQCVPRCRLYKSNIINKVPFVSLKLVPISIPSFFKCIYSPQIYIRVTRYSVHLVNGIIINTASCSSPLSCKARIMHNWGKLHVHEQIPCNSPSGTRVNNCIWDLNTDVYNFSMKSSLLWTRCITFSWYFNMMCGSNNNKLIICYIFKKERAEK